MLTFGGRARFGTAHWKLEALDGVRGRPPPRLGRRLPRRELPRLGGRALGPDPAGPLRAGRRPRGRSRRHADRVGRERLPGPGRRVPGLIRAPAQSRPPGRRRVRLVASGGLSSDPILGLVLKIPVGLLLYLVWWAFRAGARAPRRPRRSADDHEFRRWDREPRGPRGPRRGPHAPDAQPAPRLPARRAQARHDPARPRRTPAAAAAGWLSGSRAQAFGLSARLASTLISA